MTTMRPPPPAADLDAFLTTLLEPTYFISILYTALPRATVGVFTVAYGPHAISCARVENIYGSRRIPTTVLLYSKFTKDWSLRPLPFRPIIRALLLLDDDLDLDECIGRHGRDRALPLDECAGRHRRDRVLLLEAGTGRHGRESALTLRRRRPSRRRPPLRRPRDA
eukprot:scaffold26401_cov61-Phaeocystis_antarctica.AAC.4